MVVEAESEVSRWFRRDFEKMYAVSLDLDVGT